MLDRCAPPHIIRKAYFGWKSKYEEMTAASTVGRRQSRLNRAIGATPASLASTNILNYSEAHHTNTRDVTGIA